MNRIVSTAALLASSVRLLPSSFVSATTPCDVSLEDEIAVGIASEVDLLLSVSFSFIIVASYVVSSPVLRTVSLWCGS
mgnify:CR=1